MERKYEQNQVYEQLLTVRTWSHWHRPSNGKLYLVIDRDISQHQLDKAQYTVLEVKKYEPTEQHVIQHVPALDFIGWRDSGKMIPVVPVSPARS